MSEIPNDLFGIQQALATRLTEGTQKLSIIFAQYDAKASIAAIGGLLTLPVLQSNAVRLGTMSHLAGANAAGKKIPSKQDAAKWFRQVGQVASHLEDAPEDVFVTRVHLDGENYLVLEGLAEGNGHHLQHMLTALEGMPEVGPYRSLREACRSLLKVSDIVCTRAGLDAFCPGSKIRLSTLPVDEMPTLKSLGARVTFSRGYIARAGIGSQTLDRFMLPSERQDVDAGGHSNSWLERCPLIGFHDAIVVALPSAIGTALRRAVIEACMEMGNETTLRLHLLEALTNQLSMNPAIASINVPPTDLDVNSNIVSSAPVEFQAGYWFHLVLVSDDFQAFDETGFDRPGPSRKASQDDLSKAIVTTAHETRSQPGFKLGITLVVMAGFGRGQSVGLVRPEAWLVGGMSSYDLEIIGWRHGFDLAELLKFLRAELDAASKGFSLKAINGLLARIGYAYDNDGHVVPHEDLPDGIEGARLIVPINAQLGLRVEHYARFDPQVVVAPDGDAVLLRRKAGWKHSPNTSRIYLSHRDALRRRYRAAWKSGTRSWWLETLSADGNRANLAAVFEMQFVWMERIAPVLLRMVPELPECISWHLVAPEWSGVPAEEILPLDDEQLRAAIESSHDRQRNVITTKIGHEFFLGLSRADNVSETSLIRAFLDEILAMVDNSAVAIDDLMPEIVPSPELRQLHAFAPQDFRDHVRHAIVTNIVTISQFDDAAQRLGLGWHGVPRPGGTVEGRVACTQALNAITTAAEDKFCKHLARFERRALIEVVVCNHEAANKDKATWERTAGATLGLSPDPKAAREEIYERILNANGTGYASRVILEAALCECPIGTGFEIADIDLSDLMAQAMMINQLGGYSDAIHYEGMRPEIRISPAGQVQIDTSFFDAVVTPVGESFVSGQIDRSRRDYAELLQEPELVSNDVDESMDPRFLAAWKAEMGLSLVDFRDGVEALENRLHEAGRFYEILSRPELLRYLADHIEHPEAFVSSLELTPRKGWKNIELPFNDQDRQPWRFRRRLSVSRRPILRLRDEEEAEVMIVPGMIRDAFGMVFHCFYHGYYDLTALASKEMKAWREVTVAREADAFEERVVKRMRSLGWQARRGVKFSHVLGRKLDDDPGDIDVLAWHQDGRIVLLECKDLQFAKTPSEIAKQLSKFRGKKDEKGRPDLLGKHLKRVALAAANADAFCSHLKLQIATIGGALVFANTVPMSFAAEQISHAVDLLTYEELEEAFEPAAQT
ncbi:hypothetical protein C8J37_12313 [Rhizobium sp. PP-WC-1G-195]|nr:hypothetical protein C8J37_12313 [Rhizobium sp. PP-WC-1G-195]